MQNTKLAGREGPAKCLKTHDGERPGFGHSSVEMNRVCLYCEDSSRLRPIVDQKMVRKGNAADWVT